MVQPLLNQLVALAGVSQGLAVSKSIVNMGKAKGSRLARTINPQISGHVYTCVEHLLSCGLRYEIDIKFCGKNGS